MMKRTLSLILCAAMIATMFCIVPISTSAGETLAGGVPEAYAPEGTPITTPEEFAAMTADGKYYLANNITITATWNAGADLSTTYADNTAFAGVFDGNGKTITTTVPLFGNINGGTVKNLTVDGEIVATTLHNANVAMWTNGVAIFDNIYTKANILGGKAVGGILGYGSTGADVTITNCVNDANLSNCTDQAGGMVGYIQDNFLTVKNCVNNGRIESSNYAGGIVCRFGRDAAKAPNSVAKIDNCVNNGTIVSAKGQTGGILSLFVGDLTVTNCVNNGELINTTGMAAGIVGSHYNSKVDGVEQTKTSGLVLDNCVNYGKVSGASVVAGIIARSGRNANHPDLVFRVTNCENHGDVYATITSATTYYAAGICGYAYGGSTNNAGAVNGVVNCINTGDIYVNSTSTSAQHVSSIMGYSNGMVYEMRNNINLGKIDIATALPTGSVLSLVGYNKNAEAINVANNYSVDEFYVAGVKTTVNKAVVGAADVADTVAKIVTAEQAASGELAFMANEGAGAEIFFQNIGTDVAPTLDNTHKSVIKNENGTYGNPALNLNKINPLLEQAASLVEANYTAETFAALTAAVAEAKAAIALETPDQAKVDAAAEKLEAAIAALVPSTPAAVIGDVNYANIADAVAALTDGATLKIMSDITVDATIVIDKSVTIDGNGKTITSEGVDALKVAGDSLTVVIKNLNVVSAKKGLVLAACTSADVKSNVTITDTKIVSNGGDGVEVLAFWTVTLDKVEIDGSSAGFRCNSDNGANTVTVTNSKINGRGSYGFYMMQASTGTVTDSTITTTAQKSGSSAPNSAIQIKTSTAETGSTLTLNNVTASGAGYTVAVNPFNKIYINGGTYTMTTGEGYVNGDAVINVGNADAYCKITGGTFTSVKNCAARVYTTCSDSAPNKGDTNPSVLDIEGGTFILNNASSTGSALRAGTGSGYGTLNIKGGTFITNGKGAVVNTANVNGIINITGGIFENNGENEIKILENTGSTVVPTAEFPAGVKKVEFKDGAFVEYAEPSTPDVPGGETTTAPGGETTTAPNGGETTTVPGGDETTVPGGNDETTVGGNEETTTKAPENTTKAPEEPKKKNCGGFAFAAQIITILGAAITVVIVKKK